MKAQQTIALVCLASVTACDACDTKREGSGDTPQGPAPERRGAPQPAPEPLAPVSWKKAGRLRGIGLPRGCRASLQRATRPAGPVRLAAARRELDQLAVAIGASDAGEQATRRGTLSTARATVGDVPWTRWAAPPPMDYAQRGWVAGTLGRADDDGLPSAWLWRQWAKPSRLVAGDALTVADLDCTGPRCAVLTSLARPTLAPGASLMVGPADGPTASWQRVDLVAAPDVAWRPHAIVGLDTQPKLSAWVALTRPGAVGWWQVQGSKAHEVAEVPTPRGLYAVTATDQPLVITPDADPQRPCAQPQFPIRVSGKQAHVLTTTTPPSRLEAVPLGSGALVAWLGPVNCRVSTRQVVHAQRLDATGAAQGPAMAVADAEDFALASDGEQFALWLATDSALLRVLGRCPDE